MSSRRHKMQCPACGSHYTQSVSVAYSQSVRTGYNGQQTISEFGRELEPPEAQSEFLVPLCMAATAFVFTYVFFPTEIDWFDLAWLQNVLTSFWGRIGISIGVAIAIFIFLSGAAVAHNMTVHASDMKEWGRTTVCRRCGERF